MASAILSFTPPRTSTEQPKHGCILICCAQAVHKRRGETLSLPNIEQTAGAMKFKLEVSKKSELHRHGPFHIKSPTARRASSKSL